MRLPDSVGGKLPRQHHRRHRRQLLFSGLLLWPGSMRGRTTIL